MPPTASDQSAPPSDRADSLAVPVVTVNADETAGGAVARLGEAVDAEIAPVLPVLGEDGRFSGLVPLARCLSAAPDTPVASLVEAAAIVAAPGEDAAGAASRLIASGRTAMPLVGADGRYCGLVTSLAAHRYLLARAEEDAALFSGVLDKGVDDYFSHTIWSDYLRRIPWVFGLAVAGLAAGYVVHVYEDALSALVLLALYMPMVADTGGNVGTQSASLVTRALATGEVRMGDAARVLWREAGVSLLLALTLFLFAFLKVLLISNAADVPGGLTLEAVGFAIGLALALQVVTATLLGALLPLGATLVRQDPAIVSGPALTTIVDLFGLILYFTITASLLGLPAPW